MPDKTSSLPTSLPLLRSSGSHSGPSPALESPLISSSSIGSSGSSSRIGLSSPFPPGLSLGRAPAPALRGGRVGSYAVHSGLRTSGAGTPLLTLQKCAGMTLTAGAWLLFLGGIAHLVLAALHNQRGELGVGLGSAMSGAKYCLASFVLAAAGIPQWLTAERRAARLR